MSETILLGFDGSHAMAAACWAAHEARLRNASIHLLHTYDYPYLERLDRRGHGRGLRGPRPRPWSPTAHRGLTGRRRGVRLALRPTPRRR